MKKKQNLEALLQDPKKRRLLLEKLQAKEAAKSRLDPRKALFGPQLDFLLDESRAKVACCSRRAGKSYSLAFFMVSLALQYPDSLVPYITTTRESAKNIIWPALKDILEQFDISASFKQNTGDVVFENGSRILLRGCEDSSQMDKLRGPKYPGAVIDEAQNFPDFLSELIADVLEPATLDYWGSIIIAGTPGPVRGGVFFDMCHGRSPHEGWSVHSWTLRDNPHLPRVDEFLRLKMKNSGWTPDHPTYLREYCGLWVQDPHSRVYKNTDANKTTDKLDPNLHWEYVLGIDLGWHDPTAFVVTAYCETTGDVRVLESYQESELIPSEVALRIEMYRKKYNFESMVADSGNLGKTIVEDLRRTHSLPVQAAMKTEKASFINDVNGDFLVGKLQIVTSNGVNGDLLHQLALLQWDPASLRARKPKEDKRTPNHLTDAMLYAVRQCHAKMPIWEKDLPDAGTPEWHDMEEARMWAEATKRLEERESPFLEDSFDHTFPEW